MALVNLALVEANTLTDSQLQAFFTEIEKIPSNKSPINGKIARLCFEFMEDTGCRVSETINIRKKDVDFQTRILTVVMPKISKPCKCSRWKNKNEYSRIKILDWADPSCPICHGDGRWKKPQRTTFTPRIKNDLLNYCNTLKDDTDLLFPVSRKTLWQWAKKAGQIANINIFQQKENKLIKGIFVHLFRELCTKRMKRDAKNDMFTDELVACKRRDSFDVVVDRYTKIDINYLLSWEDKVYNIIK